MHIYALWCYFENFLDEKNVFGEIHLHMMQSGVQMNLERFLDVDVFIVEFMDVFGCCLHVFFNYNNLNVFNQTARFVSGSHCMFL